MELVHPAEKYKESFIEAVDEFLRAPIKNVRSRRYTEMPPPEELRESFDSYVQKINDMSLGKGLPDGYVPATEYWLVDGDRFIGAVNIRHSLTEHLLNEGGHIGYDIRPSERGKGYGKEILRLALPKAKELGIESVLVTCDENNSASKKIIEANGGVFENTHPSSEGAGVKLRYWIHL